MILVTGGTGFVGQVLVRQLASIGKPVRMLIRPSKQSPNLPRGIPVEVAVCSLKDERGLRAAMKGVDVIYHLVGVERYGSRGDLMDVDIRGTDAIVSAAVDAGVSRLFYLSHLGADRASAFPVLKVKGIIENNIRKSGINYTILRTAVVFGPNDHFTNGLGVLLHGLPVFFILPDDKSTFLQPVWVEDLVTCLIWSLDDSSKENQVYEVGGPEYLTFRQIVEIIIRKAGINRVLLPISPAALRYLTVFMEHLFPKFPVSTFWLDYLATDRTCSLDTIPRSFGLMPSRFYQRLEYLNGQNWSKNMWHLLFGKQQ
jgi:uncharacterized protein YbjT (DUF2867 family)